MGIQHGRWGVFWVLIAAYAGVFLYFSPLLLQDYPNHLARAVVMADLIFDHGQQFGQMFEYHFLAIPDVLGDWVLAALVHVLGLPAAARLWAVLVFLCLPFASWAYLSARRTPADTTVLVLLISLYLSTDTFLVMGFLSFRVAVASVLLSLALAEPLGGSGRSCDTRSLLSCSCLPI